MRILMYGWEFPPHISGGLGVACFGMTQALAEQGHHITFVLPRLKGGMPKSSHVSLIGLNHPHGEEMAPEQALVTASLKALAGTVDIRAVDSPLSPYLTDPLYIETLRRLKASRDWSQPISPVDVNVSGDYGPNLMAEILRYAEAAGVIAAAVPHDVIHAHDWLTVLAGIEAKRVSGKPLVYHVHALEFDRSGDNVNQVVYDIERYGMAEADKIVAVSHYTKSIIVGRYGVSPDKVEVVYNAVTRKDSPVRGVEDHKTRKEKVVLFLGRITFQKGPDYFVEAARKVLERRDDVRFVMAGSGDMAARMIERVAEVGMGRKFHFTGFLSGQDLERIFLESDIYVMPSVSEPFGISPLEAMYYDVPVIISRQSGVSEVLHHALKVDFWNTDELADKILALLSHDPLRKEIMEHAAEELKGIQWSNAATTLVDIYTRVQQSPRV